MTVRNMDLENEAKAFAARKERRKTFLPGRRQDINIKTVAATLKKLKEVRESMWKEKVITSDPKIEQATVEAIADVDLKIADYENQLKVLNERHPRFGNS